MVPIFNPSEAHSSGALGVARQNDEDRKGKAGGILCLPSTSEASPTLDQWPDK